MSENKDLLRITKEDEGMGVHWNCNGMDEMIGVCIAITTTMKQNPNLLLMLLGTIREACCNKDFFETLDNNCFEMPDFDAILKEDNNG